jgi:hypothetical protein
MIIKKADYIANLTVFHDLDLIAGTWSPEDKKAFDESIKFFEEIDTDLFPKV